MLKKAVLDHRAADQLVLWKDKDGRLEEELNGGRFMELLPLDDLAEVFVDQPHQKQLHILVQVVFWWFSLALGCSSHIFFQIHSSALAHFLPLPLGTK